MNTTELARRRDAAASIAQDAAALAARMRANGMAAASMKGAQDFLTEADGAAERFIRDRLDALFPGEPVLGEEGGGTVPKDGPLWILDPIDGTANFARGGHQWCVSIGMALDGRAVVGAVARHAPAELILGAAGCGATLHSRAPFGATNGTPIRAAATDDMARAIVEVGWSLRRPAADYVALLGRVMAAGAGGRNSGSGTLGLVETAIGRLDGYMELHINAWDAAAALAIAREAGCWTNAFDSGDWLAAGNPICFAAPALGPRLAALMELDAARP